MTQDHDLESITLAAPTAEGPAAALARAPNGTPVDFVRDLPIVNRKGLHARATAKFVQCVEAFDAEITVTRCGETVGGQSIMGILTLGAGKGTSITVTSKGPDAKAAIEALARLVANRFGEDE